MITTAITGLPNVGVRRIKYTEVKLKWHNISSINKSVYRRRGRTPTAKSHYFSRKTNLNKIELLQRLLLFCRCSIMELF